MYHNAMPRKTVEDYSDDSHTLEGRYHTSEYIPVSHTSYKVSSTESTQDPVYSVRPSQSSAYTEQPSQSPAYAERPSQSSAYTERPSQSSAYAERPLQSSAYTERPSQSSAYTERPSQSSAYTERPSQSSAYTERPSQSSAYTERPSQSSAYAERPSQSSAYTERPSQSSAYAERPSQSSTYAERPSQSSAYTERPSQSSAYAERPGIQTTQCLPSTQYSVNHQHSTPHFQTASSRSVSSGYVNQPPSYPSQGKYHDKYHDNVAQRFSDNQPSGYASPGGGSPAYMSPGGGTSGRPVYPDKWENIESSGPARADDARTTGYPTSPEDNRTRILSHQQPRDHYAPPAEPRDHYAEPRGHYASSVVSGGSSAAQSPASYPQPASSKLMFSKPTQPAYTGMVQSQSSARYQPTPDSQIREPQVREPQTPPTVAKEADQVDELTDLLLENMNATADPDFFGMCSKCKRPIIGDDTGCSAVNQLFHNTCFRCHTCDISLTTVPFMKVGNHPFCEPCHLNSLERCARCSKPITGRLLRGSGKAFHPQCFVCVECGRNMDNVVFTVDSKNQIHCMDDFYRKYAPRCSVCQEAIKLDPDKKEIIRIVVRDRNFHVQCYKCEDCGLQLSTEEEGRGCYPLDDSILCKSCNARRIQLMTSKPTTEL